jgi:HKD family nuclease
MAQIELILQAVSNATHAETIRRLLARIGADAVLMSVGFVRDAGVAAIEQALQPVAAQTRFFVGIRNDITSVQGVKRLLRLGVQLYAVDTGSRDTIFHPKLYLVVRNGEEAELVIGSANLTHQGLHNNIEASTVVTLDLDDVHDRRFVERTVRTFDELLRAHPHHVFQVRDEREADMLFQSGRLVDETVIQAPSVTSTVRKGERDTLPRMNLHRVVRPRLTKPVVRAAAPRQAAPARARTGHGAAAMPLPAPALPISDFYLVWESRALTERDLNVPTGATTHRTGSMLWKKGAMENIDQRHFFRDEVFETLTWTPDQKRPHLERARTSFELIIKNLNYGQFMIQLTHNTNKASKTYKQKNAMTQLHWGLALPVVSRRDLLGRTMSLYRKDTNPPEFLIEID